MKRNGLTAALARDYEWFLMDSLRRRNFSPVCALLRSADQVSPELRNLIADVLDESLKSPRGQKTKRGIEVTPLRAQLITDRLKREVDAKRRVGKQLRGADHYEEVLKGEFYNKLDLPKPSKKARAFLSKRSKS